MFWDDEGEPFCKGALDAVYSDIQGSLVTIVWILLCCDELSWFNSLGLIQQKWGHRSYSPQVWIFFFFLLLWHESGLGPFSYLFLTLTRTAVRAWGRIQGVVQGFALEKRSAGISCIPGATSLSHRPCQALAVQLNKTDFCLDRTNRSSSWSLPCFVFTCKKQTPKWNSIQIQ